MEVEVESEVPANVATTEDVVKVLDHLPPTERNQPETPDNDTLVKLLIQIDLLMLSLVILFLSVWLASRSVVPELF
jgi:hypothetical protein